MPAQIRLTMPGVLRYRALAVRVVAEAARLVSRSPHRAPNDLLDTDVSDPFDTAVVSAFMEIFNNVAIHSYRYKSDGLVEISISPGDRDLVIEVLDEGSPFDIDEVPPLPDEIDEASLPEGGMGIHIAKTMLDDVSYQAGPPNRWRLTKRLTSEPRARAVRL